MKIDTGVRKTALRTVIYGPEGIGKSTLASKFPDPLFLDIEGGTNQLDVKRYKYKIGSFDELLELVDEVRRDPSLCRTLVIDTADAAEILATKDVLDKHKKNSLGEFGYGAGYTYLSDNFIKFLDKLTLLAEMGIHVVLLSHSMMRKFEQPDELGSYDRYELKLSKRIAPLVKEWCDMLLFLNYKTSVAITSDGKHKVSGGERVMYTTHKPTWDAKNRFGLADKLPMEYDSIKHCIIDEVDPPNITEMSDMSLLDDDVPFDFGDDEPTFDDPDFTEIKEEPEPKKLTPYQKLYNQMVADQIDEEKIVKVFDRIGEKPTHKPVIGQPVTIKDYSEDFIENKALKFWENLKKQAKAI